MKCLGLIRKVLSWVLLVLSTILDLGVMMAGVRLDGCWMAPKII